MYVCDHMQRSTAVEKRLCKKAQWWKYTPGWKVIVERSSVKSMRSQGRVYLGILITLHSLCISQAFSIEGVQQLTVLMNLIMCMIMKN